MSRLLLLAVVATALSACASSWGIPLEYTPEPQELPGLAAKTFGIVVDDERKYVVSGNKKPSFLGKYKGIMGDAWDATTFDKIALADQIRNDLRQELQALQLVEVPSSPLKQIRVRINDFNFSAGASARFWYNLEISIADSKGRQLTSSVVKEDMFIKGTFIKGAKWSLEEDVATLYGELIRKLVRENSSVLDALRIER